MVPTTRTPLRLPLLQHRGRHLVCRMHLCRTNASNTLPPRRVRYGPAQNYLPCSRHTNRRRMARKPQFSPLPPLTYTHKSLSSRATPNSPTTFQSVNSLKIPYATSLQQQAPTPLTSSPNASSTTPRNVSGPKKP